mmetsp:Transcript_27350/g.79271  ORF Transcript_27350/g.79271 Transcript_27350/m.79271 type:complete len:209 (-) Transcript_27350:361-987(-)
MPRSKRCASYSAAARALSDVASSAKAARPCVPRSSSTRWRAQGRRRHPEVARWVPEGSPWKSALARTMWFPTLRRRCSRPWPTPWPQTRPISCLHLCRPPRGGARSSARISMATTAPTAIIGRCSSWRPPSRLGRYRCWRPPSGKLRRWVSPCMTRRTTATSCSTPKTSWPCCIAVGTSGRAPASAPGSARASRRSAASCSTARRGRR